VHIQQSKEAFAAKMKELERQSRENHARASLLGASVELEEMRRQSVSQSIPSLKKRSSVVHDDKPAREARKSTSSLTLEKTAEEYEELRKITLLTLISRLKDTSSANRVAAVAALMNFQAEPHEIVQDVAQLLVDESDDVVKVATHCLLQLGPMGVEHLNKHRRRRRSLHIGSINKLMRTHIYKTASTRRERGSLGFAAFQVNADKDGEFAPVDHYFAYTTTDINEKGKVQRLSVSTYQNSIHSLASDNYEYRQHAAEHEKIMERLEKELGIAKDAKGDFGFAPGTDSSRIGHTH
jgi:hypothetical protein